MFSKGSKSIDYNTVISQVSDMDLLQCYFPTVRILPQVINSPLRRDIHPSFRIYSPDGVKVRWYDFVTGESGGMIDMLQRIWGVSFFQALVKISEDIKHTSSIIQNRGTLGKRVIVKSANSSFEIRSTRREWKEYDFAYWQSYGVQKDLLLKADIYPISHIFIVGKDYIRTVVADKYAYTFVERKDGMVSEKTYQPFNKNGMKWRSGHDSSVWDLWTRLPKSGERLIITSSRKDALCIWGNCGIPAISPQGEAFGAKPQVMDELKRRFEKVYVLYDNDLLGEKNYGRIDGKKFSEQFGMIQIEIPDSYRCKDISDLYKMYGKETVKEVIKQLVD